MSMKLTEYTVWKCTECGDIAIVRPGEQVGDCKICKEFWEKVKAEENEIQ